MYDEFMHIETKEKISCYVVLFLVLFVIALAFSMKIRKKIDTSGKRFSFVIFVFGFLLFLSTSFFDNYDQYIICKMKNAYHLIEGYGWYGCTNWSQYNNMENISYIAIMLMIPGFCLSVTHNITVTVYRVTIGKMINWIKHG